MSHLKNALEKAKAERLRFLSAEKSGHSQAEKPRELFRDFRYTQTRVIDVSRDTLLRNRIVAIEEARPESEYFKLLRTQLFQSTRLRGMNTVQVSGFDSGDGASLIALNLAVSIAKDTRQTTLLVELNFRNPSMCSLLGLQEAAGIRAHFHDRVPLEELFISPGVTKLTLLTAGGRIAGPTELLGSPGMEALMRELKERYPDRYIIVDTPGISECPDPLVTSEYVDGIVLIARANRTARDSIKAAVDLLPKEKVLGIVLNDLSQNEIGG